MLMRADAYVKYDNFRKMLDYQLRPKDPIERWYTSLPMFMKKGQTNKLSARKKKWAAKELNRLQGRHNQQEEYSDIFKEQPEKLPPPRSVKHRIPVKDPDKEYQYYTPNYVLTQGTEYEDSEVSLCGMVGALSNTSSSTNAVYCEKGFFVENSNGFKEEE